MHVIGHQHIGVDRAALFPGRLRQPAEVAAAIPVVEEHRLPIIAALHDMDRQVREEEAWLAGHGKILGVQ